MSAGLQGTLQGGLASAEQEQARLMQEIAARAATAGQGAEAAGSALQQATQAPPPEVNPLGAFIQTLLGNTASVIGETPAYREEAQKSLNDERMSLLAARAQTLRMLQDNYDKQASAAQSSGDLLLHAQMLEKKDKVAKAEQAIRDQVQQGYALDRDAAQNKAAKERNDADNAATLKAAQARAGQEGKSDLKALYAGLPSSTGYQTTVRMLGSHIASAKVNTEEAAKTLAVARSLALERNKADRTPAQYAARIKRFNNMVKQLRGKDKGKWWKQILRQDPAAADTISAEEGIAAAREQFPAWELETIGGNSKTR